MTNPSKFIGLNDTSSDSTRIGFIETKNKTKYYKVKKSISELTELYDYYTNESHLFIRTNGSTPYEELGELKFAPRVRILVVYANTKVEDLHIVGSGYSAINGAGENKNVEIVNNIIEDIGGSYHYDTLDERLGNAITFFGTDVTNLKVHKNIIRNVYDVAFSIQGEKGSGKNVTVAKNIFVFNSQDSEIWETKEAQGIYNYTFEDNISFMQGGDGHILPDLINIVQVIFYFGGMALKMLLKKQIFHLIIIMFIILREYILYAINKIHMFSFKKKIVLDLILIIIF